jgi:hypothetical protein
MSEQARDVVRYIKQLEGGYSVEWVADPSGYGRINYPTRDQIRAELLDMSLPDVCAAVMYAREHPMLDPMWWLRRDR